MSQNELQRVVAELDELIARDEGHQDYCSETGPNEAMRRVVALTEIRNIVARSIASASRIEAAQAVAPGGVPDGWMRDKDQVIKLAEHLESFGWRADERGDVQCYDQDAAMAAEVVRNVLLPMFAAAPASEAKGQSVADVADQVMRDAFYGPAGTGVMRIDPAALFNKPAASSAAGELPELPEPEGAMKWTRFAGVCINPEPGYSAEQMRDYARTALLRLVADAEAE